MSEFLKCDAPDCDHYEETPVTIDVVDKPCPKCGANLCTAEDFLHFRSQVAAQQALNDLILRAMPDAPLACIATSVHDGVVKRKFHDGSGNPFPNGAET